MAIKEGFIPFKDYPLIGQKISGQVDLSDELPDWKLDFLYDSYTNPLILRDLESSKKLALGFKNKYETLVKEEKLDAQELEEALKEYEDILDKAILPLWYLELVHTTMLDNQDLLSKLGQAENVFSEIMKALSFFENDLARTDDGYKETVLSSEKLKHYHNFLIKNSKLKNHLLSEPEEQLLIDKDVNGASAWQKFRDVFEGKYLFSFKAPEDKTERQYVLSELSKVARKDPDPQTRFNASELVLSRYKKDLYVYSFIYNSIIQDMIKIDKNRRGFAELISKRNLANELEEEQVNTLLSTVRENYSLAQRYWKLKGRILKLGKLRSCDVYAPYVSGSPVKKYSYTEALSMIEDALDEFHPSLADLFENLYRCGLIDAKLKEGKRSGAYCAMLASKTPPVVFTNFSGTLNDVFTIAHEAGHWLHHVLMAEHQTPLTSDVPLTTAETASVFNEMLLAGKIFNKLPEDRLLPFLMEKIDDMFATVFRQTAFSLFEQRVFKMSEALPLTEDQLSGAFESEYGELFKDAVVMTPHYKYEWAYIPHFVNSPFYVYAYAFGELATIALFQKYQEAPDGFAGSYIKFLSSGSVMSPNELYGTMGLDISSKGTWQSAFKYISSMIDRVEKLM